jgi:HTH-type transcriptional regulator, sugar sensing transcriptional regulator
MAGQSPDKREVASAGARDHGGLARLLDADELPRSLTELGLSQNEARLYLALLRLSDGTAAQLARESGVPRPKVYEALGAMESRGFCTTVGDRVTRFRPVAPEVALRDWTRHRDHERAALAEREQALSETLIRLLPKPVAPGAIQPPDYLEAVSGRTRTTETLEDIIGRAERTVWMLMQPPWLQQRGRWNVAEAAAVRRGAQVRVVYSREAVRDRDRIDGLLRAGGECRVLPEIPMKLLVRDGVEALVSLRDARSGEQTITSVAMRHPDLAKPLGLLFRQQWKKAEPIEEAGP